MKDWDELFRAMPQETQDAVNREVAKARSCRFCGGTGIVHVSYRDGDFDEPCGCGAVPPPGSSSAVDRGCTCPVYDNAHGAGMGRDEHGRVVYVMSLDCPLHGGKKG